MKSDIKTMAVEEEGAVEEKQWEKKKRKEIQRDNVRGGGDSTKEE